MTYIHNVGLAFTNFLNTLRGEPWYRTVCATEYGRLRRGERNLVALLDLFMGKGHCQMSWINFKLREGRLNAVHRRTR